MGDYTTHDLMGAQDDIILSAIDGKPIPTNAVDRLPPWRARMVVRLALRAGAALQDGTPELFEDAARAAGKMDAKQVGWWRAALGMTPRPELSPSELHYVPPSVLPAGWSYASGESGTRTREGQ